MTVHSLSPGFVKFNYTAQNRPHHAIFPVQPYQAIGGSWFLSEKADSIGRLWTLGVTELFNVWNLFFKVTEFAFSGAELWSKPSVNDDPVFVEALAITPTTTSATTGTLYNELVFTFRTQAGGILKLYLMDTIFNADVRSDAPSYGGNAIKSNFANYILSDASIVSGRDNSFAQVGLRAISKTNDAIRKKYLNP